MSSGATPVATSSTATIAPRAGRHQAMPVASPFTGVGSLIRLALRRDRVRLSVWVACLTLTMVYAPNAIKLAYPEEAQRQARVNLLKTPAGGNSLKVLESNAEHLHARRTLQPIGRRCAGPCLHWHNKAFVDSCT